MKLRNLVLIKELRKFYLQNDWTHAEVQTYLLDHYQLEVSVRTLKRWKKKLSNLNWQGPAKPIPPVPKEKLSNNEIQRIVELRSVTGWGALILGQLFKFPISESTYKRVIRNNQLSGGSKIENKRIHWVKWQRNHPDSTWQLDAHMYDGNWLLPVLDDCSRYCLGIKRFKTMTTKGVITYLEELFAIYGKPRELLTDNGAEFGGTSKDSKFDNWCKEQGIIHVRTKISKPTTTGKIERHHATFKRDIAFAKGRHRTFFISL